MTNNTCRFGTTEVDAMGRFCAALTRQGIAFHTYSAGSEFIVEITGY